MLSSVLCLRPGVWYHGSMLNRLYLECCSAERGAKRPQIPMVLQPNQKLDTLCALSSPQGRRKEVSSSAVSVLINPKDPHTVQLGQLGNEYREQGDSVDNKMGPIVFGVEAG